MAAQQADKMKDRREIDAFCTLHDIPIEKVTKKKAVVFCPISVYRNADGSFRYESTACNEPLTHHGSHGCPAYPKHTTRKHLGFTPP
jgi:ferredoxin-like protein FixX